MKTLLIALVLVAGGCYVKQEKNELLEALEQTNQKLDTVIETLNQPLPRLMGGKSPKGSNVYVRVDKAGWLVPVKRPAPKPEDKPPAEEKP